MEIKIVKEKKIRDYTFIDDALDLEQPSKGDESDSRKDKGEPDFRLRDSTQINKLKKSKITGGHSKQGHSPVYE
jgi:hypothetical protein